MVEGLLNPRWADGSFGTKTIAAYAAWQRRLGFKGAAADGIPGRRSLEVLGDIHDFDVTN
jgi:peptidoglycan hydrolase-like protein with peptidoglycan-binding domain